MIARRILVLTAAALATGCHREEPVTDSTPAASSLAPALPHAPVVPVDHLAPGELLEGTAHAFGLTLPRDFVVEGGFADVVFGSIRAPVPVVVRYFRARLQDGDLRGGDEAASFEHVKLAGKPGLELTIHLRTGSGGTRTEIRDSTPPPVPNLPDEAARWRQAGLTPQGRLLDPKHLD